MQPVFPNLQYAIAYSISQLKQFGVPTKTEKWQGTENPPEFIEYDNLFFRANMPGDISTLTKLVKPNMPWAEDHFKERVNGEPLNPGNEYKNWPWYRDDRKFRNAGEKFTHTYMERYWPKLAGNVLGISFEGDDFNTVPKRFFFTEFQKDTSHPNNLGIRYEYGDLMDVVNLLKKEPQTRQAWLPVWFPEDTGVLHGGRVPCSIGYHFQIRNNQLDIAYTMRASEALRHFRNDIYLTVRLAQHVLNLVNVDLNKVKIGILTMHVINFHVFKQEINLI